MFTATQLPRGVLGGILNQLQPLNVLAFQGHCIRLQRGEHLHLAQEGLFLLYIYMLKTIEIAHPTPVPTPIFYSNPPFWIQTVPTARLLHKI